jgi:transposase
MDSRLGALPDDVETLKADLVAEAARAAHAEAEFAVARAKAADDQALIAHQQLRIEKLTRQLYGPRSERRSRILDQIELQFEELESSATEDEIAAEMAVAKTTTVAAFTRKRPAAVEHRFGRVNRSPVTIEWLSDNGSCYASDLNRERRPSKVRRAKERLNG